MRFSIELPIAVGGGGRVGLKLGLCIVSFSFLKQETYNLHIDSLSLTRQLLTKCCGRRWGVNLRSNGISSHPQENSNAPSCFTLQKPDIGKRYFDDPIGSFNPVN